MSQCEPCNNTPGCTFCMSSLQCEPSNDDIYCAEEAEICPTLPPCRYIDSCGSCALEEGCAWCDSSNECILADDILSLSGCVLNAIIDFQECPEESVVSTNTIVEGDLVVQSDKIGLGGDIHSEEIHIEHFCSEAACHDDGRHSFIVDDGIEGILAQSSRSISLQAASSNHQNGKGSDIFLKAGKGTSSIGGWGGDIKITAGAGNGTDDEGT